MDKISTKDARRLFLLRQGLWRSQQFGRGKGAVLKAIEALGHVQIDTISVVDRAHHHILKTRVPNYTETMLDHLQWRDRKIFEFWAHAASYLPLSEYRYYLPMMTGFRKQRTPDKKLAGEILARIRSDGPLQSRHFENPAGRNASGWWDWKPAKRVLETLFLQGELMIARRDGFQKVYDLTERVLPTDVDTTMPGTEEWCRFIAARMIRSLGAATAMDIGYARTTIRRFTGKAMQADIVRTLEALTESGDVLAVSWEDEVLYTTPDLLRQIPGRLGRRQLYFLSPFDNLVINRKRTRALFGFDYQLECYVPEAKRRYGYFCLPILWGDEFIGRLDAKAVRATGEFEARSLQLEPEVRLDDRLIRQLADSLADFAAANNCDRVRVLETRPATLGPTLQAAMAD